MMDKESKLFSSLVLFFCLTLVIIVLSFINGSNGLFSIVLIIWTGLLMYCLTDIKRHIVLFCFLISFFVFLIGRELCFAFFNLGRYYTYLDKYNDITFILMALSLTCLFIGYIVADRYKMYFQGGTLLLHKRTEEYELTNNVKGWEERRERIGKASKIAFYFCYLFSLIDVIIQIRYVGVVGYLGTYVDTNVSAPTILGYLSSFTLVALSIYLATYPSKRSSMIALALYEFYGMLTMITGHRYAFVAISMYFLVYIVYRQKTEGGWVSKKIAIMIIIATPLIIVLMNVINAIRIGDTGSGESGALQAFISFLDQQGGSVNVIKRIFYYKKELSDLVLTSFGNIRTVLFENAIIRKVFRITVYSGNSVDNALYGHFLSHRLSYYEYGDLYLKGHGTGSSYIAELFLDFSFIGVILGNLLYGYTLRRVTDLENSHYIRNALFFASQYYLYLAPRGDFDGMIGGLFSLTSILGMLGIWVLSFAFRTKEYEQ